MIKIVILLYGRKKHIDVKIEITGSNCKRMPNHGKTAIAFALMGIVFGGIPYIGVAYILLCFVLVIRAFRQRLAWRLFGRLSLWLYWRLLSTF